MADLRIPPSTTPAVRGPGASVPAKLEAVRAAQRAFFDAALGQAAAPPPAPPAKSVARLAPASTPSAAAAIGGARAPNTLAVAPTRATPGDPPQAGRLLRPGSLVDVKV